MGNDKQIEDLVFNQATLRLIEEARLAAASEKVALPEAHVCRLRRCTTCDQMRCEDAFVGPEECGSCAVANQAAAKWEEKEAVIRQLKDEVVLLRKNAEIQDENLHNTKEAYKSAVREFSFVNRQRWTQLEHVANFLGCNLAEVEKKIEDLVVEGVTLKDIIERKMGVAKMQTPLDDPLDGGGV